MKWLLYEGLPNKAVAIYNYLKDEKEHLNLLIGDDIEILHHTDGWFMGFKTTHPETKGIFPKTYVHLLEYDVYPTISDCVRNWVPSIHNYFVDGDSNTVNAAIEFVDRIVIEKRNAKASSLSTGEQLESNKRITMLIAQGNRLLSLPVLVRNDKHDVMDPLTTPSVELYRGHVKTLDDVKSAMHRSHKGKGLFSLVLSVSGFDASFNDGPLNISIFLVMVDKTNITRITDTFTDCLLISEGRFPRTEQVIFTDFETINADAQVHVVVHVVKLMLKKSAKKSLKDVKYPYGVGCYNITQAFNHRQDQASLSMPVYTPSSSDDSLDSLQNRILTTPIRAGVKTQTIDIEILKFLPMEYKQVLESSQYSYYQVAKKFGLPHMLLPSYKRNELFVTLGSAELRIHKGVHTENCEVRVSLHDISGSEVSVSDAPVTYRSVVYHTNKPRWMEVIRFDLPPSSVPVPTSTHIRFLFTNTRDGKTSVAFLLLHPDDDTGRLLPDGEYCLNIHKMDLDSIEAGKYYSLPTDAIDCTVVARHAGGKLIGSMMNLGHSNSPYRGVLTVQTRLCSTERTNNESVYKLLHWQDYREELLYLLERDFAIPEKVSACELMKFAGQIFNSLMEILADDSSIDEELECFESAAADVIGGAVMHLLEGCFHTLNNISAYRDMIADYLAPDGGFKYTTIHNRLLRLLILELREGGRPAKFSGHMPARCSFSKISFYFKIIVRSKCLQDDEFRRKNPKDCVMLIQREQERFDENVDMLMQVICQTTASNNGGPSAPTDTLDGRARDGDMLERRNRITESLKYSILFKHIGEIINDLLLAYDAEQLTNHFVKLIESCAESKEAPKDNILQYIIQSKIFDNRKCRLDLLEPVTFNLIYFLKKNIEKSLANLGTEKIALMDLWCDILLNFFDRNVSLWTAAQAQGENIDDQIRFLIVDLGFLREIVKLLVVSMMAASEGDSKTGSLETIQRSLASVVIGSLQLMNEKHWKDLLLPKWDTESLKDNVCRCSTCFGLNTIDAHDMLCEFLTLFKCLSTQPVFPVGQGSTRIQTWTDMLFMQTKEILTALERIFNTVIQPYYLQGRVMYMGAEVYGLRPTDEWSRKVINLVRDCLVSSTVQPHLQLESLPKTTRERLQMSLTEDLRSTSCRLFEKLWHSLGGFKEYFIIPFIGSVLKIASVTVTKNREAAVNIIFDMMEIDLGTLEHYLVSEVDRLMEQVDPTFKSDMERLMHVRAETDRNLFNVFQKVSRQMHILEEYAKYFNDTSKINGMLAINNLRNFYQKLGRQDLYLRYLYKLVQLHRDCGNITEMGHTLLLISNHLKWTEESVDASEVSETYSDLQTERDLKEQLCLDSLACLEKEDWERAIEVCDQLVEYYRHVIPNYAKLSQIYHRQGQLYQRISSGQERPRYTYFMIPYEDCGYPSFISGLESRVKQFIYRGIGGLRDVIEMIEEQFPNERRTMTQKDRPQGVVPVVSLPAEIAGQKMSRRIKQYYEYNMVSRFTLKRNLNQTQDISMVQSEVLEFEIEEKLPGVLPIVPVIRASQTVHGPHDTAIHDLRDNMQRLSIALQEYEEKGRTDSKVLAGILNGTIDANVQGGLREYMKLIVNNDDEGGEVKTRLEELTETIRDFLKLQYNSLMTWDNRGDLRAHLIKQFVLLSKELSLSFGFSIQDLNLDLLSRSIGTDQRQRAFTKTDTDPVVPLPPRNVRLQKSTSRLAEIIPNKYPRCTHISLDSRTTSSSSCDRLSTPSQTSDLPEQQAANITSDEDTLLWVPSGPDRHNSTSDAADNITSDDDTLPEIPARPSDLARRTPPPVPVKPQHRRHSTSALPPTKTIQESHRDSK